MEENARMDAEKSSEILGHLADLERSPGWAIFMTHLKARRDACLSRMFGSPDTHVLTMNTGAYQALFQACAWLEIERDAHNAVVQAATGTPQSHTDE